MLGQSRFSFLRRALAVAGAVALGVALVAPAEAQSRRDSDVTITIERVKALDLIDWGLAGQADFFARVTIAGETINTQRIRGQNEIQPNWQITKRLPAGRHAVKLEIYDRDPLKPDDRIDINRVANKRDLDFVVNTRTQRVEGFAQGYKFGQKIVRAGEERKKAEITFSVSGK